LLGAIEAMNLIDEKERALSSFAPPACRVESFLEIGNARKDCRHLLEDKAGFAGKKPRDGRLAGARRAPQDDGWDPAGAQQPGQYAIRPGDVILTDHIGELGGPQYV